MNKKILILLLCLPLFADGQVLRYGNKAVISGNKVATYKPITVTPGFLPSDLDSLALWLKADAGVTLNGSTVSAWADQSGSGNNAIQSTTDNQPTYISDGGVEINNKPAIKFDGINDVLTGSTITDINNSSITIFAVLIGEAQTGVLSGLFDINSYTNGFTFGRRMFYENLSAFNNGSEISTYKGSLSNNSTNTKVLCINKKYGLLSDIYIDGILEATSNNSTLNGSFTNGNYIIGYSQGWEYFKGSIAELIVYRKSLSTYELENVNNYFKNKYKIKTYKYLTPIMSTNTSPYNSVSSSSQLSWGYSAYFSFNHIVNANNGWVSYDNSPQWLQYKFDTAKVVNKYIIIPFELSGAVHTLKSWTLEASNDGTTWITLDTHTGVTSWSSYENKEYVITNTNSYYYYKINMTENNGTAYFAINQLLLLKEN